MARLGFQGGENGLNKVEYYSQSKFGKYEGNMGTENILQCTAVYGKQKQPCWDHRWDHMATRSGRGGTHATLFRGDLKCLYLNIFLKAPGPHAGT
jgi:hypothetical protein